MLFIFPFRVLTNSRAAALNTVLEVIGDTPLVRINKIAKSAGLKCELCKKLLIFIYICVSFLKILI